MFLADDLVLAHSAIENGVHHVDVSLCTFKKPVRFLNGKYARIILVLAAGFAAWGVKSSEPSAGAKYNGISSFSRSYSSGL